MSEVPIGHSADYLFHGVAKCPTCNYNNQGFDKRKLLVTNLDYVCVKCGCEFSIACDEKTRQRIKNIVDEHESYKDHVSEIKRQSGLFYAFMHGEGGDDE